MRGESEGAGVIVLLDNRDSFTFNLAQALQSLGQLVEVRSARDTSLAALRTFAATVPTLGVCLGFQAMGACFGARIVRSGAPLHGRAVPVQHDGRGLFLGLPSPLVCTRYNSLAVAAEALPECLTVSARDERGELMGLRHTSWPLEGVQFHPESVLSEHGAELLTNFLAL